MNRNERSRKTGGKNSLQWRGYGWEGNRRVSGEESLSRVDITVHEPGKLRGRKRNGTSIKQRGLAMDHLTGNGEKQRGKRVA